MASPEAKEVKEVKEVKEEAKQPAEEKKMPDLLPEQYDEEVDKEKKERTDSINLILNQFKRKEEGCILVQDFTIVLRALDQNPSEIEMKDYIAKYKKVDKDGNEVIENASIHELVEDRLRDPDTEDALKDAFMKILDKDGKLSNQEFIHLMTTRGNPIDEEIAKAYIQYADQDKDGFIEVENFVQLLMSAKK